MTTPTTEFPRVSFVGTGKLAQTLAAALTQAGIPVVAASSRSHVNQAAFTRICPGAITSSEAQHAVDAGQLVFLSVSDDAIAPVCASLRWKAGQSVVHCSGATEVEALAPARRAGAHVGGFHPMQMFADPQVALAGLPGCTVGIEADADLQQLLERIARVIGCQPFRLPAGVRPLYHASAYYVGPFLIALLQEGAKLWAPFGASEQQALQALLPLLQGTASAVQSGGLAQGMGGCVARGDVGTVRRHLRALDSTDPAAGTLYRALALRNVPLGVQRGTLAPARADEITHLLNATQGFSHGVPP
jgi:predicted short-subunit dehydrogenase-like oxidoreductase (DUF2520 family)